MTYGELKDQVRDYLQFEGADGANQVVLDRLIAREINNARLWMERKRDWKMSVGTGQMLVPASGARLSDMVDYLPFPTQLMFHLPGGPPFLWEVGPDLHFSFLPYERPGVPVRMKSLLGARALSNLEHGPDRYELPIYTQRGRRSALFNRRELFACERSRVSASGFSANECALLLEGDWIYPQGFDVNLLHPFEFIGYLWLDDYTDPGQTDFLLEYCPEVLLWKAILNVNHRAQLFVPRQEGGLAPPLGMLEDAWRSAVEWDTYINLMSLNVLRQP